MSPEPLARVERKVLLFGGAGFVGCHLAAGLVDAGHQVTCVGRRPPSEVGHRLPHGVAYQEMDDSVPTSAPFDVVVHLACDIAVRHAITEPESFIRANLQPTLTVGCFARRMAPMPLVLYLSSDRVYGASTGTLTECSPTVPVEPYGAVKLTGENLLTMYSRMYDFPLVVVRAANLYGPFQRPVQLIPSLIQRIQSGETRIPVGDLNVSRNFLYIADLVAGLLAVIEHSSIGSSGLFNLGGEVHRIGEVVEILRKLGREKLGRELEFFSDEALRRPGTTQLAPARLSSARAEEALGWKACVSLGEGLARIIELQGDSDGAHS